MKLQDVFNFNNFVTLSLVKFIYWCGLAFIFLAALTVLFTLYSPFGTIFTTLGIFILWAVCSVFWRLICEATVLSFKIFDRLTEIRDRLPQKP